MSGGFVSDLIELDNNATTRPTAEVVAAVSRGLTSLWHNPSSVHRGGQAARAALELARADLAALVGVRAREITLTGSGTEAIDLGVRGLLRAGRPGVVVTDDVEHAAVRDLAEDLGRDGVEVRKIPLTPGGVVDVAALPGLIEGAGVVSVQWANNETGAVQPIERVHEVCRAARVPLHCDGTQWVGKMPVAGGGDGLPPCDVLTFSPHKFHGPKGVGVLWARRGVRLRPLVLGSQELGRRGGTENVAGVLGAGAAAREALAWLADAGARDRLGGLRDRFEAQVLASCRGAVVNGPGGGWAGDGSSRLWNTTNIGFPRLEAEALLLLLSERGLSASAGAACSSGSLDPSPVLLAMGVPDEVAHGSVRFSLSRETTEAEIEAGVGVVAEAVGRLRGSSASL